MPRPRKDKPDYCKDKSSGRAFVTIDTKRKYLGKWAPMPPKGPRMPSHDEYDRIIGEWIKSGRAKPPTKQAATGTKVSVLLLAFLTHAETYYRKPDGTATSELHVFKMVMKPLRRLYGATVAEDFGPLALKSLRDEMIRLGWSRRSINKHTHRVRSIFKWGSENIGLPGAIYQNLRSVAPLKAGRSDAKETERVKPVPDADIQAVRPLVSRQVRAMIDLQLLCGARPGEVCIMRACDINRSGTVWTYTPASHKTQHHGHDRVIRLGPQAQKLVQPFFKRDLQAFIFAPIDAEAERLEAMHDKRKKQGTALDQGNVPGTHRVESPKRRPAARYTVVTYRRAIARACEVAFGMPAEYQKLRGKKQRREFAMVLREMGRKKTRDLRTRGRLRLRAAWRKQHVWHPHQLRHNAGTYLRRQYGLEAARAILGHSSVAPTELYAEIDGARADEIMCEVG